MSVSLFLGKFFGLCLLWKKIQEIPYTLHFLKVLSVVFVVLIPFTIFKLVVDVNLVILILSGGIFSLIYLLIIYRTGLTGEEDIIFIKIILDYFR